MSDNLQVEPENLFYNTVNELDSEADNPSEPDEAVNDEPTEDEEPEEEPQGEDESEEEEVEESGDFLFTLDDEEVDEKTVLSWKQAAEDIKSMQADYTRKTQGIAETVKAKVEEIKATELAEINALKSTLEELLTDDKDLDELLEWDTDEYKKERSRREKRDKALEKARKLTTEKPVLTEEKATAVYNELVEMNSDWMKDGKLTDEYEKDIKLMTEYIKNTGMTSEEYQSSFNVKTLNAFLKLAKYEAEAEKTSKSKAKLKPVIRSKVKSATKKKAEKSLTDYFYN